MLAAYRQATYASCSLSYDSLTSGIGVPRWNREPMGLSPAADRQRTAKRVVWFTWNRLTVNWQWRLIGLLWIPFLNF